MAFLLDNCVLKEKLPFGAYSLDYSSELNLFAVLNEDAVYAWNPETKKSTATFDIGGEGVTDVLFLPGNYIAVPHGEGNHGSDVSIFSLDEKDAVLRIFEDNDIGQITLTPDKNVLGVGEYPSKVSEVQLDLKNMKVLQYKDIWAFEEDDLCMTMLCCSSNYNKQNYEKTCHYTVCCGSADVDSFSCVDVGFSADGELSLTNKQTITYCMINGEERRFGNVLDLAHDGEHVIVATDQDIVVLESATEGSPAHVIVSSAIPRESPNSGFSGGRIRLNNKNQLMVCDSGDVIKVYDYKRPNCLQGLCRCQINKSLKQHGKKNANIEHLPIPQSLKDYLLYKV